MELPVPISTRLQSTSRIPFRIGLVNFRSPNNDNRRTRLGCNTAPVRAELSSDVSHKSGDSEKSVVSSVNSNCKGSSLKGEEGEGLFHRNVWEETDFVEVIGIGSRKDAILDFCLASSSRFPALRIWNILVKDSGKVLLQQRFLTEDISARVVEVPLSLSSCSKAIILVASAAYGEDIIPSLDILTRVRSADGLVIGIILKPFSFEGQRRKDEVNELVDELQKQANFCIVIDTDALLAKDLLTLDEALKTSYNAVLMATNAISVLVSENHIKFRDLPSNCCELLEVPQLKNILEIYREAKIGYGAGYNIKTSILRATYDCPFLGVSLKELDGVILCVIASSNALDSSNVHTICHTFRQTTGWKGDIVISIVYEPNVEANLILTTIIMCGCVEQQPSHRNSLLSRLAQHFPFIFNILKKPDSPLYSHTKERYSLGNPQISDASNLQCTGEMLDMLSVDGTRPMDSGAEDASLYDEQLQEIFNTGGETLLSKGCEVGPVQSKTDISEADFSFNDAVDVEGVPTFRRELLTRQNLHPGFQIPQDWGKEGTDDMETYLADNVSTFKLPVGVKQLEQSKNGSTTSNSWNWAEWMTEEIKRAQTQDTKDVSWDRVNSDSEAKLEMDNHASRVTQADQSNFSKKKGVLSIRAASMLESERASQKKWVPVVEMKYRGGIYRGHIQGGLPEGKGHLSLRDGSVYDGMWRYGKRSGLGTFYFSNGDIYRGLWRDDVMHGKGWFYFHTGDRWFVNFWKGKANGEGRFYYKHGDISFGHFKDGWRHGQFLHINIDGTRCLEVWDEGTLESRKNLDSDIPAG
nr:protein ACCUMULATION AND REPLICATION OF CHLOROPLASTS 3 [Ipomoea batatas]